MTVLNFSEFIKANLERPIDGDMLVTPAPENGAAGILTPSLKNGFVYPYVVKTGAVIHSKSMDSNVLKVCLSQGRVIEIGTYQGDNAYGVAEISWRDELKDHSMKIKKPISLLDKEYWGVLESLKPKK